MKRFTALLSAAALVAFGSLASAQVTISSTNYSLDVFDSGYTDNDGAVYNLCWFFTDGSTQVFADNGFTNHTNQVVATNDTTTGSSNSATLTAFGSSTAISGLTGSLAISIADGPGTSAVVTYAWQFDNSTGSPIDLTVVKFLDGDVTPFASNLTGFTDQDFTDYTLNAGNTVGVPGIGLAGTGGAIDLSTGYLLDADTAPTAISGFGDSGGSSFWWSDSNNYSGLGVESNDAIATAMQNIITENGFHAVRCYCSCNRKRFPDHLSRLWCWPGASTKRLQRSLQHHCCQRLDALLNILSRHRQKQFLLRPVFTTGRKFLCSD